MVGFLQPAFVSFVAAYYVAMQINTGSSRTTWFGLLNVVAVAALFGLLPAATLLAASTFYSVAVRLCQRRRQDTAIARCQRFVLYASVVVAFVWYKMWQEPATDILQSLGMSWMVQGSWGDNWASAAGQILETLAFSYVALRVIDFIRAGGAGERVINPLALSAFFVPFFMSPSGPVNEYERHIEMDEDRPEAPALGSFIDHIFLIVLGYFLKFVVAYLFSLVFTGVNGGWPTNGLLDTAIFLTFVLIEFSGYSFIALGVGKLLGVPTPLNFNHPYLSTSFTEFWTRWHMSLGAFVRRTFYFPVRLALTRAIRPRPDNRILIHSINTLALLVPFAFVGLWHRFTIAFLLWGVALALVVAAETVFREEIAPKLPWSPPRWISSPLGIAYTLFMVVLTLQIAVVDFAS